jgi:hypothetical protein
VADVFGFSPAVLNGTFKLLLAHKDDYTEAEIYFLGGMAEAMP